MIAVHQWITKLTLKTLMDDSWRGSLAWPHPPQSFTNTQSKLFKLSRLHTEWWHAHMQTLSQTSPPRRGSQESYSEIFEHSFCLGSSFFYLISLGGSLLNNLNILLTEEATGEQVVQDALNAPQPGHEQLSVVGEEAGARHPGFFYLIHIYRTTVSSVEQKIRNDTADSISTSHGKFLSSPSLFSRGHLCDLHMTQMVTPDALPDTAIPDISWTLSSPFVFGTRANHVTTVTRFLLNQMNKVSNRTHTGSLLIIWNWWQFSYKIARVQTAGSRSCFQPNLCVNVRTVLLAPFF